MECNDKEQHGFYVLPAVVLVSDSATLDASPLARCETFAPILVVEIFDQESEAIARHEAWAFGLTASIFTSCDDAFFRIGGHLSVGNLYRNLPTTFSPSTLPFGGWGTRATDGPVDVAFYVSQFRNKPCSGRRKWKSTLINDFNDEFIKKACFVVSLI